MSLHYLTLILRTFCCSSLVVLMLWAQLENAVGEVEEEDAAFDRQVEEIRRAAPAIPAVKGTDYDQVIAHVGHFLQREHYSRRDLDQEMCQVVLERYFETLDPEKIFWHEGELAVLRNRFRPTLQFQVFEASMQVASEIFLKHRDLVRERVARTAAWLKEGLPALQPEDKLKPSRTHASFEKDAASLDALWRKRLHNDLINDQLFEARKVASGEAAGTKQATGQRVSEFYQKYLAELEQADQEEIGSWFLSALCHAFDPHSEYLDTEQKERFDNDMRKKLVGIGIRFAKEEGRAVIESVITGGPAAAGGSIKPGDRIVALAEGETGPMENVEKLTTEAVADKIRGEEGSVLRLELQGTGKPPVRRMVTLKRASVDLKENRARAELIQLPASQGGFSVGWLIIENFYGDPELHSVSLTSDVERLLERLEQAGMDGLVVDLRGNPGGYLDEGVALAGLFLDKGPVVLEKDAKGREVTKISNPDKARYNGPLAVMTDGGSASASEIFAAVMQDRGRAVVVGEGKTFGKGTVQAVLNLKRLMPKGVECERVGTMKLTIRKFYRVAGGSTQLRGVEPDISLPSRHLRYWGGEEQLLGALPYDSISKRMYPMATQHPLPLDTLRRLSAERTAENSDLKALSSEMTHQIAELEGDGISLNAKVRLAEQAERLQARKVLREERGKNFELALANQTLPKVFQLNLHNVNQAKLDPRQPTYSPAPLKAGNGLSPEEPTDYPLSMDPTKQETIFVLRDLIQNSLVDADKATAVREISDPVKEVPPATIR